MNPLISHKNILCKAYETGPALKICLNVGDQLFKEKRFEEALTVYGMGAVVSPSNSSIWKRIADAELELRKFAKAVAHYTRSLLFEPNQPSALLSRATCKVHLKGEKDELVFSAQEDLQKAYDLDPSNKSIRNWLAYTASVNGSSLMTQGKFEEARSNFILSLSIKPNKPKTLMNMGACHCHFKNYTEANACFTKAKSLFSENDPDYVKAFIGQAKMYSILHKTEQALKVLQEAITLFPENGYVRKDLIKAHIESANKFVQCNNHFMAIEHLSSALALDSSAHARHMRALSYIATRQYEQALGDVLHLPKDGDYFTLKGEIYKEMKKFQKAVETYQEACLSIEGETKFLELLRDAEFKAKIYNLRNIR